MRVTTDGRQSQRSLHAVCGGRGAQSPDSGSGAGKCPSGGRTQRVWESTKAGWVGLRVLGRSCEELGASTSQDLGNVRWSWGLC